MKIPPREIDSRKFRWVVIALFVTISSILRAQSRECRPHAIATVANGKIPLVLYTDIQSAPTSGGEYDQGIYLSVFGKNFGRASAIGRQTKVFIGDRAVAAYRYFGTSRGRPDIQQITVQIGSLHGVSQGTPLPVIVDVTGAKSNANIIFTPNSGTIYFVDNVKGNESTATAGDITRPYRYIQTRNPKQGGIWQHVRPGDFIVMRGTGKPWQDIGFNGYFVRFQKSGTAPRGRAGTGPITLMGYPGEDVFINETYAVSHRGAIAGVNRPHRTAAQRVVSNSLAAPHSSDDPSVCEQNRQLLCSQWITVADLRIEGGGDDGPINLEIGGNHWRVVNNTLSAKTARSTARSGGITGDGLDAFFLGNTVHDVDSVDPGLENHGIYIDGPGSYTIEYNYIHNIPGGSGFQVYGDETPTHSFVINHVGFDHNWIDHVAKYCINLADNVGSSFAVYDNVSSFCGMAGIRLNSRFLNGVKVYNNTFYAGNSSGNSHYGVISIDKKLNPNVLAMLNNIFVSWHHMPYMGGDAPLLASSPSEYIFHNLYFGGTGGHAFDPDPTVKAPGFVDDASCDFRLRPASNAVGHGSPAVHAVVKNDFDLTPYLPDRLYDIGAYAYHR